MTNNTEGESTAASINVQPVHDGSPNLDALMPGPTENLLNNSTSDPDALLRDINDTVMSAMLTEMNNVPSEGVLLQAINLSLFSDFDNEYYQNEQQ